MQRAHRGPALTLLIALMAGCSAEGGEGGDSGGRPDTAQPPQDSETPGEDVVDPFDTYVEPIDTGLGGEDASEAPDVITVLEGGGVYDVPMLGDACPGGGGSCSPRPLGCVDREVCDDGLDNNCDGRVDESCPCLPGSVQRCFLGPPGRRGVGACQDGMQTCQGTEIGQWSECMGGIAPRTEACDMADNDCDGCVDNGLCCVAVGTCPSGDDPRVPVGRPFQQYRLTGSNFYPGGGHTWSWTIEGGPCDQLLYATSRRVTYTIAGAGSDPRTTTMPNLTFTPTLSGDYTVRLRVTPAGGGMPFECTFLIKVRAPGFRAELCWDRTGSTDIDFWVHDPRNRNNWGSRANTDTCAYYNCRNDRALNWGYSATTGTACREPSGGRCNNPRLDIDNIDVSGVPENINVDAPRNSDNFRVAVNYFGGSGAVQPMVNIYCGGALRATYGGAMVSGRLYGSSPISGFNTSGADSSGSLWRVVDVLMSEPADTCELTPLVPRGMSSGNCVQNGTDRSYDGNCQRRP